eukprot:scaffold43054_cov42-Phaeocystis_antarctica.AAC.2
MPLDSAALVELAPLVAAAASPRVRKGEAPGPCASPSHLARTARCSLSCRASRPWHPPAGPRPPPSCSAKKRRTSSRFSRRRRSISPRITPSLSACASSVP